MVYGITGGIGAGKSIVSQVIECLGYKVYYADIRARLLSNTNMVIVSELKKLFGDDIYINGCLNRGKVAEMVFSNHSFLASVNSIIHPVVAADFDSWVASMPENEIAFKEAAILFESQSHINLKGVICVVADDEVRIQRVIERDGILRNEVQNRIKNQWPQEKRIERSQYVIDNSGRVALLPQILNLIKTISVNGKL